jgi:hypothetical protein
MIKINAYILFISEYASVFAVIYWDKFNLLLESVDFSNIYKYILFGLAAFSNSVMDVCKFHWHKSIFSSEKLMSITFRGRQVFSREWWDGTVSWLNKYIDRNMDNEFVKLKTPEINLRLFKIKSFQFTKPVQLTDSFHWFKMLMILFLCLAISESFIEFVIYSTIWIQVFNLFYNKILKKKKEVNEQA